MVEKWEDLLANRAASGVQDVIMRLIDGKEVAGGTIKNIILLAISSARREQAVRDAEIAEQSGYEHADVNIAKAIRANAGVNE